MDCMALEYYRMVLYYRRMVTGHGLALTASASVFATDSMPVAVMTSARVGFDHAARALDARESPTKFASALYALAVSEG